MSRSLRLCLPLLLLATPCHALPGVIEKKDIAYAGTDDPHQKLDFYAPEKPRDGKPLPLVIFIHGGGWKAGDKSQNAALLPGVVLAGGYAMASVEYRFSQQAVWPAQIHDCKAAVRYLRAHAKELNLDPDHFAVSGMSAGGHLALLIGLDGDSRKLEGNLGPDAKESSRVSCVINWFGPVEFSSMNWSVPRQNPQVDDNPLSQLLGAPVDKSPELAKEASPLTYVHAGNPPVFTAQGTADPLVPYSQAVLLDQALRKANVPSYFVTMQGGGHGFNSNELNKRLGAFLEHYLRGSSAEIAVSPLRPD